MWRLIDEGPTYRMAGATSAQLREADGWSGRLVHWDWATVMAGHEHCLYALLETPPGDAGLGPASEVAALFALARKARLLEGVATTRLDFFEVRPSLRGGARGRAFFAMFARLSADLGRRAIALQSLPDPKVIAFYTNMGAVRGAPKGWNAPKDLVAMGFQSDTLDLLLEVADGFAEEKDDA